MARNRTGGLGDLPLPLTAERAPRRKVFDPGTQFVTDYINRNSLTIFPFQTKAQADRILPANPLRTYLIIQNNSGGLMYVNFGTNPTPLSAIRIFPGREYEFTGGVTGFSPADDIFVLGDAAGQNGSVGEGLYQPEARFY